MVAHDYVSTACLHIKHNECRKHCKFCDQWCQCACHIPGPNSLEGMNAIGWIDWDGNFHDWTKEYDG